MKNQKALNRFGIPPVLALLVITLQISQSAAIKIMPLGDSITQSLKGHNSYRYWLWKKMIEAKWDVDMVGSMKDPQDGQPYAASDFDQDHEGHWGWTTAQVLEKIDGWASSAKPDIVLLHLGSNDAFQNHNLQDTKQQLGQVIDGLRKYNPKVTFLMAQIIGAKDPDRNTHVKELNGVIADLIKEKTTDLSKVILVNQFEGFDPTADTFDGVHPAVSGEKKMADKWYAALNPIFTPPTTVASQPKFYRNTPVTLWLGRNGLQITLEHQNVRLTGQRQLSP